ncbi:hypothetical protein P1X14_17910 [Sphingomonas sp. AOB5]|uniref:hypothetical protein n=1 Tax=Sphingomonas sp. AOB5 TaxID=3034017 RepID=UPI0023F86467|nr:hypothetical protein [Sphingomonas sp. AOB5]MDF7777139.1 hypothetical protein [Sphingomonas sp. AOB5]
MLAAVPALASGPAGSIIPNTATVSFSIAEQPATIASNQVTFRLGEILDLQLTPAVSSLSLGQGLTPVAFTLTNTGNGHEPFTLSGRLEGVDATVEAFAIDMDGDGQFDPAHDLRIEPGAATPPLAPGASIRFLALVRASAPATGGKLIVATRAVTGSGTPGTGYDGQGDDGCDAVVGATTASAEASVTITMASGDPDNVSVVKSQSVVAPNGDSLPVRGATVTYTLETRFGGSGAVRDARLADTIPTGTAYVPGSLRLDGAALTDAGGDDAGSFDGAAIRVALGDIAGPAVRTIQFQVKIK